PDFRTCARPANVHALADAQPRTRRKSGVLPPSGDGPYLPRSAAAGVGGVGGEGVGSSAGAAPNAAAVGVLPRRRRAELARGWGWRDFPASRKPRVTRRRGTEARNCAVARRVTPDFRRVRAGTAALTAWLVRRTRRKSGVAFESRAEARAAAAAVAEQVEATT